MRGGGYCLRLLGVLLGVFLGDGSNLKNHCFPKEKQGFRPPKWTTFSCRRLSFSDQGRLWGPISGLWVSLCDICAVRGSIFAAFVTISKAQMEIWSPIFNHFACPDGHLEPHLRPFVPTFTTAISRVPSSAVADLWRQPTGYRDMSRGIYSIQSCLGIGP